MAIMGMCLPTSKSQAMTLPHRSIADTVWTWLTRSSLKAGAAAMKNIEPIVKNERNFHGSGVISINGSRAKLALTTRTVGKSHFRTV